jgi:hypothetical protein
MNQQPILEIERLLLRQRVRKWGVFEDVALIAILHKDWKHGSRKAA